MSFSIELYDAQHLWLIPDGYDAFEHELFRNFPERRWRNDNDTKGWVVPASRVTLEYINKHWREGKHYAVSNNARLMMQVEELTTLVDKVKSKRRWEYLFEDKKSDFDYPYVLAPFDHQRVAVEAAYGSEYFGFLMEMGTGKTKCVIDELLLYALAKKGNEMLRVCIVCPKGLMINWQREFDKNWPDVFDYSIEVLNKGEAKSLNQLIDLVNHPALIKVCIVSYDSVRTLLPHLLVFKPNYVAYDESHKVKNPSTTRYKSCHALSEVAAMRRILTGSPTGNTVLDVFSQFELLRKSALGYSSFSAFKHQYAIVQNNGGFETVVGYYKDRVHELKENMATMSFVVKKERCLDLPEKMYDTVEVTMPESVRAIYDEFAQSFAAELSDGVSINTEHIIVQMLKLSQICSGFVSAHKLLNRDDVALGEAEPEFEKVTKFLDNGDTKMNVMIDDAMECIKDGKLIIWSRFKLDNFVLESRFKALGIDCKRYDSSTSDKDRQIIVDRFNNDDAFPIFIGNPGAGGTGLTLLGTETFRTKNVFYYSNDFSFLNRLQSEDRCHRIGLRNPILYKDYVYSGSIEQYIATKLQAKKDLGEAIKNVSEIKEFLLKGRHHAEVLHSSTQAQ